MTGLYAKIRRSRPLLGTFVEISLSGTGEARLHKAADRAFAEIGRIQRLMSRFDPASDISRINRGAASRELRIDPDTWRALALAREVAEASDGAFDITVGSRPRAGASGLCSHASYDDIELLPDSMVRIRRKLSVDLGGIAKGYAVDIAAAILENDAALSGCVNAGGDLRAFGGCDHQVQIRDPEQPYRTAALAVVRDQSIATSASYPSSSQYLASGSVIRADGSRAPGSRSATVRASRCAVADALTKAVLLLGDGAAAALAHFNAQGFLLDSGGLHMMAGA